MKLVLTIVLSPWQMELADSKLLRPVRAGAMLKSAKGVWMVAKGKHLQNQQILQTNSSSV